MDGKQSKIQPSESLPLTDRIYRHGLNDWVEKKGDENIPKFIFFELTELDKKTGYRLSVDWELKTTPEETIARIGGSYKTNTTQFKEYKNRIIFALDIKFLNSLDFVIDVNYNPIVHPVRKLGSPNNVLTSSLP